MKTKLIIYFAAFLALQSCVDKEKDRSASYKRFKANKAQYEAYNEFYTEFKYSPVTGIGYEEGITRRDPSGIIKADSLYYVWYTRTQEGIPVVGIADANDTLRAYDWDLAEVWYATSPDGHKWTEKGVAVKRGPEGSYDARSVFTTDVLVANGKYYLFYQAAGSLKQGVKLGEDPKLGGDFLNNVIGMSWADSPDGPWHRMEEPVLKVGAPTDWDSNVVHDPSLIVRNGQYWLYYKSSPRREATHAPTDEPYADKYADIIRSAIGVAMADKPEGPYIKSKYNPVIVGGHETIVYPYRKGVCAILSEGPERRSIQYAEDGINFYEMFQGIDEPDAAGVFRVGNFTDTDIQPGQGITWGLHHRQGAYTYLERFDCDLSLERGEEKAKEYKRVQEILKNAK